MNINMAPPRLISPQHVRRGRGTSRIRILEGFGCQSCDTEHTLQHVCLIQQRWWMYGLTLERYIVRRPDV